MLWPSGASARPSWSNRPLLLAPPSRKAELVLPWAAAGKGLSPGPKSGAPVVVAQSGQSPSWRERLQSEWKDLTAWVMGQHRGPLTGREVLEAPEVLRPSRSAVDAARSALRAKAAEEAQAVGALGGRAESYRRVASLIEGDLPARLALQKLLLSGRLATPALVGGQDLLSHLSRLGQQPLGEGLARAELLADLVEECENPTMLAQGGKGTCAATSMSILLVRQSPAEYARLVADLAAPAGQSRSAGGDLLRREAGWAQDEVAGRSQSIRLLQPALMEFANGWQSYDQVADSHRLLEAPQKPSGLWSRFKGFLASFKLGSGQSPRAANRMAESLTGRDFQSVSMVGRWNREALWKDLQSRLAAGHSVPVGLAWITGGHKVVLDRVAGGWAYYSNPWGQQERMPAELFKQRIRNANLPVL